MIIRTCIVLSIGCFSVSVNAQIKKYNLENIISLAKEQSPASKQAETRKENRYWQYRFYKSNYNPQLRLSGDIPNYQKVTTGITQPDGSISFRSIDQTNTYGNVSLLQPIPWTGGVVSVNSYLSYFNNNSLNISSWNGSPLSIRILQPLFSFNQLKWDRTVEPLRYEESKRANIEELELVSRMAAEKFFLVLDSQIELQNATSNLVNNEAIFSIEQDRFNVGTTTREKLLQARLQFLKSKQEIAQAKINLKNSKLELRFYLGLQETEDFELELPSGTPILQIDPTEALRLAKANRADYLSFKRRKIEADREVAIARGQQLQASVSASFGLNNSGANVNNVYINPLPQQTISLAFNLPIIDWGRNKARIQTALANKRLNDYVIATDEGNFEQEIINRAGQFDVLLSQIEITKESADVALERYAISQEKYMTGKLDITILGIALSEKDNANRSYINSLKLFWIAFYDLRRLTLYDFVEGKSLTQN